MGRIVGGAVAGSAASLVAGVAYEHKKNTLKAKGWEKGLVDGALNNVDVELKYPSVPAGELVICGAVIGAATGLSYHAARLFPVAAAGTAVGAAVVSAACAFTPSSKP